MKINGRLLLLVAVAALFVRVWTVNEPRGRTARRARSVAQHTVFVQAAKIDEAPRIFTVSSHQPSPSPAGEDRTWTTADCPLPIPAGLSPGTYRLASDDGRIARLFVPAAHDAVESNFAAPDFLATTIGGVRWYFIRLAVTPSIADVGAADEQSVDEDSKHATVIRQSERPSPPALPSPL